MYTVTVSASACTGCEACMDICPQEVFRMAGNVAEPFRTGECVLCESCLGACLSGSITITEV